MSSTSVRSPERESLADRLSVWLATGLGVGLASPAPGTVGGLWGLLLLGPLAWLSPGQQALALVGLALGAAGVCGRACRTLGEADDPGAIVLDEIVALPWVFLGRLPAGAATLAAGWLLFRLYDIVKPWPIRRCERIAGGAGIVADDLAAAAAAWVTLEALLRLDVATEAGWLVS